MTSRESLNQTMDKAVTHYASLFWLPSFKRVILLLITACMVGGLFYVFVPFSILENLPKGLLLGVGLFCVSMLSNYVVSTLVFEHDPIYNLRRMAAISLYCWAIWLFFIFIGVVAALTFDFVLWIKLCLLGFSAIVIFRLVVISATSSSEYERQVVAALMEPFLCVSLFLLFWGRTNHMIFLFLLVSVFVGLASSHLFLSLLNRVGNQTLGIASLSFFKAFLLNWVADLNAPFEEHLERLGEKKDVEVFLIKFSSQKTKAVIVVPSVHPGPFKNIGSSLLPSLLKTTLEKKLNCIVSVPHGLFGHEFDLASQHQNQNVIDYIVQFSNFETSETKATPFVKVSNTLATACCQIFGNFAIISFSLAPNTTEDLPPELGIFVLQEAKKRGLNCCVAVNAHNSMDGAINPQQALEALKDAAVSCLEKAFALKQLPFKIGAATITPKEFGLRDGIGPGGIAVTVVKVGEQETAYVVIDGNNMVVGLREKILSALLEIGINEGEVLTTDTHSVNAVVLGKRGYHPVGEVINHEILIRYIKEATLAAVADMEPVKAACHRILIPEVKVIGEKLLATLCLLIDKALQTAKKVVFPIFAACGVFLMFILTLI